MALNSLRLMRKRGAPRLLLFSDELRDQRRCLSKKAIFGRLKGLGAAPKLRRIVDARALYHGPGLPSPTVTHGDVANGVSAIRKCFQHSLCFGRSRQTLSHFSKNVGDFLNVGPREPLLFLPPRRGAWRAFQTRSLRSDRG